MEVLDTVLQRPVIIALAVAGAVVATIGSVLMRKDSRVSPGTARLILRVGYGLAWASVVIFIVAGFLGK
jgi:drug/metabolite transporter (DMT)-like permease